MDRNLRERQQSVLELEQRLQQSAVRLKQELRQLGDHRGRVQAELDEIRRRRASFEAEYAADRARKQEELNQLTLRVEQARRLADSLQPRTEPPASVQDVTQKSGRFLPPPQFQGAWTAVLPSGQPGQSARLAQPGSPLRLEAGDFSLSSPTGSAANGPAQALVEQQSPSEHVAQPEPPFAAYQIPERYRPGLEEDAVPVAPWAQGVPLQREVVRTAQMGPRRPEAAQPSVHLLFGRSGHPFDARGRYTQMWGRDRLQPGEGAQ